MMVLLKVIIASAYIAFILWLVHRVMKSTS